MRTNALRVRIGIALVGITIAGFLFKLYRGPFQGWANNYGAGLLYEIFWILLVFFILPQRTRAGRIAAWVFIVTCVLEILQLWHPPFLEKCRSTFFGSALIGTTFSFWDFPHYAAGCLIGWIGIKGLSHTKEMANLVV